MNAADVAAIQTLLGVNALGLILTNYGGLDATGKTEVATALFNIKSTLTTEVLIQSAVTTAIGTAKNASDERTAWVAEYTNAADAAAVETLLDANALEKY